MPQGSDDSPSLMDTIRAHPVRSALLATPVALITICCAIAQSWQSFTDKKIPDWFSQNLGWVFVKYTAWQLWLFAASIVAFYCLVVYILFRPRRPGFGKKEYYEVLSKLAEGKRQKASGKESGGYSTLQAIAATAQQRSRDEALRPKPNLIAQFKYVGIYGMTGGAGITVRLEIRNAGTPSIADKFTATLSSDGFSDELFPAPMPPNAVYADETGGMRTIKPSDTLYQKLRQPIPSGDRVTGFLFYFAKGVSPAQLTAREPTEIVIRFRDVTFREYSVSSEGVTPLYPPGVVDPFTAISDTEEANATSVNAKIEHVKFYDTSDGQKPYLLMLVLVLVKNTGAPTAVSGWRLSFKSPEINVDHLKAAGRQTNRTLGDGIILYKKDSLIEKLDLNPVSPGIPVRGWLDYYFENKKLNDVLGKMFEMRIGFQDAFSLEGAVESSGLVEGPDKGDQTAYFPGIEPLRALAEAPDTLPANRTHVAIDRLYELGREGKAMLERLRHNKDPIPTQKDVEEWADKLAGIASSVGSYGEKTSFKVHYSYLGLPPITINADGFPAANAELAKSILAKLALKTALLARLLTEDQMKEFMPPS